MIFIILYLALSKSGYVAFCFLKTSYRGYAGVIYKKDVRGMTDCLHNWLMEGRMQGGIIKTVKMILNRLNKRKAKAFQMP